MRSLCCLAARKLSVLRSEKANSAGHAAKNTLFANGAFPMLEQTILFREYSVMILRLVRLRFLALFLLFAVGASAQTPATSESTEDKKQSIADLRSRVAMILADPSLRRGRVGVKIVSASTGSTIYERDAAQYFMPASNMKSYTVATALETLSANYRFRTSVYVTKRPDSKGTIDGNLIVFGRGDPTFSETFSEGEPFKRMDELADAIVAAGVKKVKGALVGDESYFNSRTIPFGWEWDDLQWYYGAELSALTAFDNTLELKVMPSTPGSPAIVQIQPFNRLVRIINTTNTSPKGSERSLRVTKRLGQNTIEISGNVPLEGRGFRGFVAVSDPAAYFVDLLASRLRQKGVDIKGGTRTISADDRIDEEFPDESVTEIAHVLSPPLSLIAAKTMKPSQNLYTELLLRAVGEAVRKPEDKETASDKLGKDAVEQLLLKTGAEPRSIIQYDGSGLSRHNLITADSAVRLFQYMDKSKNGLVWRNCLTIGGVDGTLKNQFRGSSAEGNVRGKTGTIDQVSALSGYVTSKSGERFVFSILTNFIPSTAVRRSKINSIVIALADFDGKTGSD